MEVWELKLHFYPSAGGLKKKKEKKDSVECALLFFCCSIQEDTAADAIARPACTRCLRRHREEKRSYVARVSTVGARGRERADFRKTSTRYEYVRSENIMGGGQNKVHLAGIWPKQGEG